jgi:hypothetical protein
MTSTPEMTNAAMSAYAQDVKRPGDSVSLEGMTAAINAALAVQWQPIETGPRDGRTVLLGCLVRRQWRWIASGFHNSLYLTGNHEALAGVTHWQQMPDTPQNNNDK